MFKVNMHWIDRFLRLVVGALCVWAVFWSDFLAANEILTYVVGAFGAMNIVSAVMAHCPVYLVAGLSTCSRRASEKVQ